MIIFYASILVLYLQRKNAQNSVCLIEKIQYLVAIASGDFYFSLCRNIVPHETPKSTN